MIGLTPRQKDTFACLESYFEEHGVMPTVSEIKDHLKVASKSRVVELLNALEERGYIRRIPNRAIAIEILTGQHGAEFHLQALVRELQEYGFDRSSEAFIAACRYVEARQ